MGSIQIVEIIWNSRNQMLVQAIRPDPRQALDCVYERFRKFQLLHESPSTPETNFSSKEDHVVHDLPDLCQQHNDICTIFTDAAFKNERGGTAALMYNAQGRLQLVEGEEITAYSPLEAELHAIKTGISKALQLGWQECRL